MADEHIHQFLNGHCTCGLSLFQFLSDIQNKTQKMQTAFSALLAYLDSEDVFLTDRPTGNCSGRRSEKLVKLLEAAKDEVE